MDALHSPDVDEVYVTACHGVSKTMTAAAGAEHWLSACGWPFVSTAPTSRQVNDLLWRQIRINRMNANRQLPGKIQLTPNIVVPGRPDWFGTGFTTDKPDGAQGPHRDNLLVIVDEAAGIKDWLWTAIKGWITNPGCKILAIGNPNTLHSTFRAQFFEFLGQLGKATVRISCYDSPNVTRWKCGRKKTADEQEDPIPGLADDKWVDARKAEWGESSVEWRCKGEGEWIEDEDGKCLPMVWIVESINRAEQLAKKEGIPPYEPAKEALDVARKGKDHNALVGLDGNRVLIRRYWDEPDTMKAAKEVAVDVKERKVKPLQLAVDENAVGGPVLDRLQELKREDPSGWGDCEIVGIDWGSESPDKKKAVNLVSWLYRELRRLLNPATPLEDRLILPTRAEIEAAGISVKKFCAQLNARGFEYDENLRFKVESKKSVEKTARERGGEKSPDIADALAATLFKGKKKRKVSFWSS